MRSVTKIVAAGLLAAGHAMAAEASQADDVRTLNFNVFLDEREIGYQRFTVKPTSDGTRIETQARFEVKVLRITAFTYDHRNTELWRDGCLQMIEARTDSNGKKQSVSGRDRGSGFVIETPAGERRLSDCVASFAYWDRSVLLDRQRLLNSQTGDYMPVRIDALGRGSIRVAGRDLSVDRYAIRGEGVDIAIAYAADSGEWVSLASKLDSGRTLRYLRNPGELSASSVASATGRPSVDQPSRYTAGAAT